MIPYLEDKYQMLQMLACAIKGVYDQDVYNNQKFQTDFWAITDG